MKLLGIGTAIFLTIGISACSNRIIVRIHDNILDPEKVIIFNYQFNHFNNLSYSDTCMQSSRFIIDDTIKIYYPDNSLEIFTKDSVYVTGRYYVQGNDTLRTNTFNYYRQGRLFLVEVYHSDILVKRYVHLRGKKYKGEFYMVGIVPKF